MRRISYGRIFMGGLVVNAALSLFILLLNVIVIAFDGGKMGIYEVVIITIVWMLFGGAISGLLCMLVLALFGKSEESVSRQEESKKRIVYVVTDKEKSPKETEDISRYMPR